MSSFGGLLSFREERGEDEDIMQARKENEEKYSVYFWRQKKKTQ